MLMGAHSEILGAWGPGGHFIKGLVGVFHRLILKATEILASDWLRANLSVRITDKMLDETPPWSGYIKMPKISENVTHP